MKRGEDHIWICPWGPVGFGIKRSSDGKWKEGDKELPWFWFKNRKEPNHPKRGFSLVLGEYTISVGWYATEKTT